MHNLKQLRDNSPNKKNNSPQFSDDGIDAHTVHSGRKGGNKIDNKQGAEIGLGMLESLKKGELEIVSVSPPEFNDPAKLANLVEDVRNGKIKQSRVETSSISEEGRPRRKRMTFDMTGGPVPRIDIVYQLPQHK